eukprot:TRINITY_DN41412_c0_g1_i1.p1 TRINITY_DN41412_c0_g1~~TRINITY_DN41412_c0_g1_i1.p1  ORF type:complete len:307 (+),score=79.24 TRINITY_DN41412_c0_g1_i1:93-1013(+)
MGQSASCAAASFCDTTAGIPQRPSVDEEVLEVVQKVSEAGSSPLQRDLPRLLGGREKSLEAAKVTKPDDLKAEKPQQPTQALSPELEALRKKILDSFVKAAKNGELHKALSEVQQARQTAKDQSASTEAALETLMPVQAQETSGSRADRKVRKQKERSEARQEVSSFLLKHGFGSVKSKKSFLWRTYYPLHQAVSSKDGKILRALLKAGADPEKRNSKHETPRELAARLNRRSSHDEIMTILDHAQAKQARKQKSMAARQEARATAEVEKHTAGASSAESRAAGSEALVERAGAAGSSSDTCTCRI